MKPAGGTTLLGYLRRERHALFLLAALLFAAQWVVPVAFAGPLDSGICFGDPDHEGPKPHDEPGCCPCVTGCGKTGSSRSLPAITGGFPEVPPRSLAATAVAELATLSRPSGINPFDAFGRGPPARS